MRNFLENPPSEGENHAGQMTWKLSSLLASQLLPLNASHSPATRMKTDILATLMGFAIWRTRDYLTFIFLASNNDKLYKGIWPLEENLKIRLH